MIYLKRSLSVLGRAMLVFGAIWLSFDLFNRSAILPDGWNRPDLAVLVFLAGLALSGLSLWIGRRIRTSEKPRSEQPTTEEMRDFIVKKTARTADEEKAFLGPAWDRRQTRAQLKVTVPPRPTKSWIGGLPCLPQGTPWPVLEGQPASFIAQIAMSDLPDTVFRGIGPRQSSLVFFTNESAVHCEVLLVSGDLRPCAPPEPTEMDLLWTEATEVLTDQGHSDLHIRPRWYLEVADPDTQQSGREDDEALQMADPNQTARQRFEAYFHPFRPEFQPFDWPSALLLLGQIKVKLEAIEANPERGFKSTGNAAKDAQFLARVSLRLSQLTLIIERFEALAETTDYDDTIHQHLMDALKSLPITTNRDAPAFAMGLLIFAQGRDAARPFEAHLRRCYTEAPESIPDVVRRRFEQIWTEEAARDLIYIGNSDAGGIELQTHDLLIDLPTSHLTGTHFGDMSRLWVENPPLDFARGTTANATADNSHGGY